MTNTATAAQDEFEALGFYDEDLASEEPPVDEDEEFEPDFEPDFDEDAAIEAAERRYERWLDRS
jgi:hypothetical protein